MAMTETDMDASLKVIIVGNGQVGKTSMMTRFARGVMTDTYKKTIGTDFMEKNLTLRTTGEEIKLLLWDTAGQEMFSKLTKQYYRGAGAVAYVFSTTDRESFMEIARWKQKVEEECGEIASVLVQNKTDLLDQAQVTTGEVEKLAEELGITLYRICVKNNVLVDDVFHYLAETYLKRGGESTLSHPAVADITAVSSSSSSSAPAAEEKKVAATTSSSASAGVAPAAAAAAPAAAAAAPAAVATPAPSVPMGGTRPEDNKPFVLGAPGPSKQRTGGKKRTWCTIL